MKLPDIHHEYYMAAVKNTRLTRTYVQSYGQLLERYNKQLSSGKEGKVPEVKHVLVPQW